jgi:glycosyltransferase involved in cell wall biosynthesis
MRVAIVYRNFSLDGSLERDSVLTARALVDLGVEVHCFCNPRTSLGEIAGAQLHDVRPLLESRRRLGYAVERASFAYAATAELRRRRDEFDIVDVRGPAGWEHDVVTVHGVAAALQRRWPRGAGKDVSAARLRARIGSVTHPEVGVARAVERLQFRPGRFSRVVAVTQQIRDDIVEVHGVPRELIDVVDLPIDYKSFEHASRNGLRAELGITDEDRVALFVGHDFERKGLRDAIAALPLMPDCVHLVVVGAGSRGPFEKEATLLGVASRVHFVGPTDQPSRHYGNADVFLLPTRHDPWGLTLIEAMAAGIPIVTTAAAGASAVVRQADAGIVLSEGRSTEVGQAVTSILADDRRRSDYARNGRRAARRFSTSTYGQALVSVYERVLAQRRVARSPRLGP